VQISNGFFCCVYLSHADESTANSTGGLRSDDEDLQDFSKLLEAFQELILFHFSWKAAHKKFYAALLSLEPDLAILAPAVAPRVLDVPILL